MSNFYTKSQFFVRHYYRNDIRCQLFYTFYVNFTINIYLGDAKCLHSTLVLKPMLKIHTTLVIWNKLTLYVVIMFVLIKTNTHV